MTISDYDQHLIQKCVDAELTSQEQLQLIERLQHVDNGWKQLACGFLEDRALREMLADPDRLQQVSPAENLGTTRRSTDGNTVRPAHTVTQPRTSKGIPTWWSHPLVTVGLCIALAFTGGQLMSGSNSGDHWFDLLGSQPEQAADDLPRAVTVNVPGRDPFTVPIVSPEVLSTPVYADTNSGRKMKYIGVRMPDGRLVLVPVTP